MRQQKINDQPRLNNFNLNFILTRNMNNTWPLVRIFFMRKLLATKSFFGCLHSMILMLKGLGELLKAMQNT